MCKFHFHFIFHLYHDAEKLDSETLITHPTHYVKHFHSVNNYTTRACKASFGESLVGLVCSGYPHGFSIRLGSGEFGGHVSGLGLFVCRVMCGRLWCAGFSGGQHFLLFLFCGIGLDGLDMVSTGMGDPRVPIIQSRVCFCLIGAQCCSGFFFL